MHALGLFNACPGTYQLYCGQACSLHVVMMGRMQHGEEDVWGACRLHVTSR